MSGVDADDLVRVLKVFGENTVLANRVEIEELKAERDKLYRCALRYRRQRNKARGEAAQLAGEVVTLRLERDAAREWIGRLNG